MSMSRKPMNYEAIAGTQSEALRNITLERLEKWMENGQFDDVNFSQRRFYFERRTIPNLRVYSVPVVPPLNGRIPFNDLPPLNSDSWKETHIGAIFGPTWSTHWFQLHIDIPQEWSGQEVHLIWDTNSEAMIWSTAGQPLQGLTGTVFQDTDENPRDSRFEFVLPVNSGSLTLLVEMAGNGLGGQNGIRPPPPDRTFELSTADVCLFDAEAWAMKWDMQVIFDMARELPQDSTLAAQCLRLANALVNVVNPLDRTTWELGREMMRPILGDAEERRLRRQARRAAAAAESKTADHRSAKKMLMPSVSARHHVTAIGHCHIDSAWLWPYAETKRKVARSWATQLEYMDRFPGFKFVGSSAQQYQWLSENYPQLFTRVRASILSPDGGFRHVGGTWVEMDTNMPSGESLVRQFLLGQRYFERQLGSRSRVFWLPDTFGYSGQLPQIVRSAGIEYFLTQKLSWNNINVMPHHTFFWEGIDGSEILTHFPPIDNYNADGSVADLVKTERNYKDKQSSSESLLMFGIGDGGGGPQRRMIEQVNRLGDVEGLPTMDMDFPEVFFDRLKEKSDGFTNWVGELYFELHRGTYTSQAATKLANRSSEQLMKNAEFFAAVAHQQLSGALTYPIETLTKCWEHVCLNQFHDVLPGTCIAEVYTESSALYDFVAKEGAEIVDASLHAISGNTTMRAALQRDSSKLPMLNDQQGIAVFNALSFERTELVETPLSASGEANGYTQKTQDGVLSVYTVPSLGYQTESVRSPPRSSTTGFVSLHVSNRQVGEGDDKKWQKVYAMKNDLVEAEFLSSGRLTRLFDTRAKRDLIPSGKSGNTFVIFDDIPLFWDAWDVEIYHLQTRKEIPDAVSMNIVEDGPLRVSIDFQYQISDVSSLRQRVSLSAISPRIDFSCHVDWHENRKFLKVEFPVDIRNESATYECAFGALKRPTIANTSVDIAKFEVCTHRWMDLSEPNFGVALINSSKYGAACHRNVMRISLLKAPKSPDDTCDMGEHDFDFALFPHAGDFQAGRVVQEAHAFNNPLIVRPFTKKNSLLNHGTRTYFDPEEDIEIIEQNSSRSYFSILDADNVILDTVKRAEDSNSLVLRFYEAHGSHATARVRFDLDRMPGVARLCNILEDDDGSTTIPIANNEFSISLTPFQFQTVKLLI